MLRLDRGDQAGRRPGPGTVPEANAERSAISDFEPAGFELAGVRVRVADVGDRQLAAFLEHPCRFAQRPCALVRAGQIVNRQRADHHVERTVVEGQLTHVGSVKLDSFGHALEGGVLAGNLLGVARLIRGAPDIDTDGPSEGQALGRHQQHRAAAAADVQQPLVSFELEPIEQLGPDGELARAGGVDEDARIEKQPERARARSEDSNRLPGRIYLATPKPPRRVGEQAGTAEGHQERSVWCVEAVGASAPWEGTHGENQSHQGGERIGPVRAFALHVAFLRHHSIMRIRSRKTLLCLSLSLGAAIAGAVLLEQFLFLRKMSMTANVSWTPDASSTIQEKLAVLSSREVNDLPVGGLAPDLLLPNLRQPGQIHLAELWSQKPLVLIFGSFSCDVFDELMRPMQALHETYQDRMEFLIVCIREAGHKNVSARFLYEKVDLQNETIDNREQRSCRAADYLHITIPMASDREDRKAEMAYLAFPMRIVVVDTGGNIPLNAGIFTRTVRPSDQFGFWLKGYLTDNPLPTK